MDSVGKPARKAILFHLEETLEAQLASALRASAWEAIPSSQSFTAAPDDVIFCNAGAAFLTAKATFPGVPVVVVNRVAEIDQWLDALEAGAADYVAAPFEEIKIRWLLQALPATAIAAVA